MPQPPAFDSPGGYSGCGDAEPTALPDAPSELMPPPPPPLDAADGPAAKKARKGAAPGERRMIGEVTAGELGTSGMRRTLGR